MEIPLFIQRKKLKKNLLNRIENLNNELHDKEYKIKKLVTDIKDKEISIKEEQINTLIKSSNSSEIKKDDLTKRINDLQGFITGMKKEIEKDKKEINKLIDENNIYKSKNNELKEKVEKLEQEKNNLLNNNNKELKDLKDQNDEKNNQIEELVKKINDQEIQYKGMKYDNQELIIGTKQCINDMRQKENKIKKLTNENESLKKNNRELNEKVIELNKKTQNLMNNNQLFNEEKNKLINNCNDLKNENDKHAKEIKEKTDNIEYLNSILLQKTEIIDKLQKTTDELTKELEKIKLELKKKQNDIKQLESHYNKLKNNNFSVEIVDLIDENNKLIIEKQNIENKLEETENDMKAKINKFTKENEILQNKIDKLSNENTKYNKQLNEINTKYYEIKKLIIDKDKELNNMKEASKAILEKHKKLIEENEKIDPTSCRIITNKKYKKLTWYLIRRNTNVNSINTNINNIYNNYFWVNGNILPKEQLAKFNKFDDDEQKQKDMQDYIFDLQKKLERKEESISRLDYKNKKLTEQLQNKTTFANNKMKFNLGKNNMINNSNYNYSMNINGSLGDKGFESERFKNILQQLNNSNMRETKLQNEVIELKQKLKKKEEFEAGIPKTCKEIEPYGNDSGFLDDDIKEKDKNCIMDLVKMPTDDKINSKQSGIGKQPSQTNISSINGIRENEKKVDLFLKNYVCEDEDQDEVKQMNEMYGMTSTEYLKKYGVFNNHVMLAHGVHIDDASIVTLRDISGGIVHNPISNMKLGSGFADIKKLHSNGINVALGPDGQGSTNTLDMFEEIKLCAYLQKGMYRSASALSAEDVIKMATVEGAKVLGIDSEVGSLEENKKADIIIIGLDKSHLQPIHNIYSLLAYSVNGADVETTIIDGKIVMEDRKVLNVDEHQVIRDCERITEVLFK